MLKYSCEAGTVSSMVHFPSNIIIFIISGFSDKLGSCRSRLTATKSCWNGLGSVRILLQLALAKLSSSRSRLTATKSCCNGLGSVRIWLVFVLAWYLSLKMKMCSFFNPFPLYMPICIITKSVRIIGLEMTGVYAQEATNQGMQQIEFSSNLRQHQVSSVLTSTRSIWIIGLGSARVDLLMTLACGAEEQEEQGVAGQDVEHEAVQDGHLEDTEQGGAHHQDQQARTEWGGELPGGVVRITNSSSWGSVTVSLTMSSSTLCDPLQT